MKMLESIRRAQVQGCVPWDRYLKRVMTSTLLLLLFTTPQGMAQTTCPDANPNDFVADDAPLQACLNNGGLVLLDPGSPGYILSQGLVLSRDGTVLRSSQGSVKATLIAHPDLANDMLQVSDGGVSNYEIADLIFDGNRDMRPGNCYTNLRLQGRNFSFHHVDSLRTICGSSVIVLGSNFLIYDNRIVDSGLPADVARDRWADGLTVLLCDNGYIHNNLIEDSTDIALVIGGGDCSVQGNTIRQVNKWAFAGLNVGNFNNNGYHTNSVFQFNTVESNYNMLSIGILVGSHPWSTSDAENVWNAGRVINNVARGAVINLVVDGIERGEVTGNVMYGAQGDRGLTCAISTDYTAWHFSFALIQPGWFPMQYDLGASDYPEPCRPQE